MRLNPWETNPTVEWKERRKKILRCSYCRPNQFENSDGSSHRLKRSWKKKNKTRRQWAKVSLK